MLHDRSIQHIRTLASEAAVEYIASGTDATGDMPIIDRLKLTSDHILRGTIDSRWYEI